MAQFPNRIWRGIAHPREAAHYSQLPLGLHPKKPDTWGRSPLGEIKLDLSTALPPGPPVTMNWMRLFRRPRLAEADGHRAERWQAQLRSLPILQGLEPAEARRLIALGQQFLQQKRFVAAEPAVILTDALCIRTALQAALPVLGRDLTHYATFYEVRLYADLFAGETRWEDDLGLVHESDELLAGEAWEQGPLQFSVVDIEASGQWNGYNVVIHELAHKLDMASGAVNGCPPLATAALPDWQRALDTALITLERQYRAALKQGWSDAQMQSNLAMDPYALTNEGEFFAVSSESFFSRPCALAEALPDWYRCLQSYYRQDPRRRAPTPGH